MLIFHYVPSGFQRSRINILCLGGGLHLQKKKKDSDASQEADIVILPSCVTDIKGGGDDEVWSCPVEKEPYPGVKGI